MTTSYSAPSAPSRTPPALRPRRKARKVGVPEPAPTFAGITARNPLYPYVEYVLHNCVGPHLEKIMADALREGNPISSREQLLKAYKAATGSRVSMTTFSQWLNTLGYRSQRTFGRPVEGPSLGARVADSLAGISNSPTASFLDRDEDEEHEDPGDFDNLI